MGGYAEGLTKTAARIHGTMALLRNKDSKDSL